MPNYSEICFRGFCLVLLAHCFCIAANRAQSIGDFDAKVDEFFAKSTGQAENNEAGAGADSRTLTNNWAVIVGASRFWFNYRHVSNALSIYRSVKRYGIPDSQIILMISDDMACDARNPRPATVFNNGQHHINVYGDDVEVDYRGYEVTSENFIRLLTGRVLDATPKSKRLLTNSGSNILIYMTGHGGDGFLKFQDSEELTAMELANAFEQMHVKRRYNEVMFIIDTCQGESMSAKIYSPNIIGMASSKVGEDSLSHHGDPTIGVYVIDRYTYYVLEFLERSYSPARTTLGEFFTVCPKHLCISTVSVRADLYERDPAKVLLRDFFGNIADLKLASSSNQSDIWISSDTASDHRRTSSLTPVPVTPESKWNLIDPFDAASRFGNRNEL